MIINRVIIIYNNENNVRNNNTSCTYSYTLNTIRYFILRHIIIYIYLLIKKDSETMKHIKNTLYIIGFIILSTSCSTSNIDNKKLVFFGTNNPDPTEGIAFAFFNDITGELTQPTYTGNIAKANFFSPDTLNSQIHFVGESINKLDSTVVQSIVNFSVNKNTGKITPISKTFVHGKGPCYIEYNNENKKILIANYVSGNICSFDYDNNNISFEYSQQHYGSGPSKDRQEGPHAHSIRNCPNSNIVYAADLGADKIMVYRFNNHQLEKIDSIGCLPGAGPRHIDFSPSNSIMAVVNELNCTVTTYKKDSANIYSKEISTIQMLPDTFSGFAKAADIHFSPDGKFVYASNRGYNSIVVYKVNDGNLELVEIFTESINWPRNFTISNNGKFLLVANRDSNNITVLKRDEISGKLTFMSNNTVIKNPVCVRFYQ